MSVGKGLQKLPDNLFGLPVVRKHVSGAGKIETGPVKSPDHAESGLDIREEFSEGLFPEYDDSGGVDLGDSLPEKVRAGHQRLTVEVGERPKENRAFWTPESIDD
jgi:hypothetical protein